MNLVFIWVYLLLLLGPIIFVLIQLSHAENGYIPSVAVGISKDGGKSFTENLLSMPSEGTLYVKYEISVKTKGLYWLFFGTKIEGTLIYPQGFELVDYAGFPGEEQSQKEYDVTVSSSERSKEKFHVTIAPYPAVTKKTFTVIASNRPKKTEIVLRFPEGHILDQQDNRLTLKFKKPIETIYDRTIVFTIPETRLK